MCCFAIVTDTEILSLDTANVSLFCSFIVNSEPSCHLSTYKTKESFHFINLSQNLSMLNLNNCSEVLSFNPRWSNYFCALGKLGDRSC